MMNNSQVKKHIENLNRVFNVKLDKESYKKIQGLERKMRRAGVRWSNGDIKEWRYDEIACYYRSQLNSLLWFIEQRIPVYINSDARGYAFKLDIGYMLRERIMPFITDMGGDGIIAPE